ncbi:MAG: class I SAM-dependent DNA methyltransferase [Treponema sp.]|uniref:type I restriction-modification system subunit M n=1 Tax=Treponema sp. TaxID=166 RepID=UPI002E983082|nr:class I SAM-dependent DNA methyltransferase [Treponema sp.]
MSNLSGFVKRIRDVMRNDAGINGDAQRIEQIVWMLFLKVYDAKEEDWEFEDEKYESIIPEDLRWRNWAHSENQNEDLTGDNLLNFVNNKLFPTLKSLEVTPETPIRQSIVRTTFEDANNYMKDGVLLRQIVNIIDELDFGSYEETHAFGEIYETILKELQSAGSAGEFYTPRAVTQFMAKMIRPQIGENMADFACGTGGFLSNWIKELEAIKDAKGSISNEESEKLYNSIYAVEKKQFPYMLCVTNMLLHGIDSPKVFHGNSLTKKLLDYTEKDAFDVILMNPPYGGSEKEDIKQNFPADLRSSETADLFMAVIMYRLKKKGRAAVIVPDGFLFGNDNAKNNLKKKLLTDFNLHTIVRLPGSVFSPYTSITTNILFFNNEEPSGETWFYRVDIPSDRKHFSKTKPMELKHFDGCIDWWNNRKELLDSDGNPKAKKYTTKELLDNDCNLDLCGYPHEEEEILSIAKTIQNYKKHSQAADEKISSTLKKITEILGIEL